MKFEYIPQGVCSRRMTVDINPDGTLGSVVVEGGCPGNLQAVMALARGMDAREASRRMAGLDCRGKGTSCPDQLARAIAMALEAAGK